MPEKPGRWAWRFLAACFLGLYLFANASLHSRLFHVFPGENFARFPAYLSLGAFIDEDKLKGTSIHVSDIGLTEGMWISYFLRQCDLTYDRFIPNFLYAAPIDFRRKEQGWFVENSTGLKDLWAGRLVNEQGRATFYQQLAQGELILSRKEDKQRYHLEKEVYSSSLYTLFERADGNLAHLIFYDGALVFQEPLLLSITPSSLTIAGRTYTLPLGRSQPSHILLQKWGQVDIAPESAATYAPPYVLLELSPDVSRNIFTLTPRGTAALNGSLNLIEPGSISGEALESLPRTPPPWNPVLPDSNLLLMEGCHALEREESRAWRWTDRQAWFYLEPSVCPSFLRFKLLASPVIGQEVALLLNGQELARMDLNPGDKWEGLLPLGMAPCRPEGSLLHLVVSKTFQPHAFNSLGDERNLGVCLHDLTVSHEKTDTSLLPLVLPGSSVYLVGGCHEMDTEDTRAWRWTKKQAEFYIEPQEDLGVLRIRLSASPYIDQKVLIRYGHRELALLDLSPGEAWEKDYPLDNEDIKTAGMSVTVEVSETFQPHAYNALGDKRNLGICINELNILSREQETPAP